MLAESGHVSGYVELALRRLRRRLEHALLYDDEDELNAFARELLVVEYIIEAKELGDYMDEVRELRRAYVRAVIARGLSGYPASAEVRRRWRARLL